MMGKENLKNEKKDANKINKRRNHCRFMDPFAVTFHQKSSFSGQETFLPFNISGTGSANGSKTDFKQWILCAI